MVRHPCRAVQQRAGPASPLRVRANGNATLGRFEAPTAARACSNPPYPARTAPRRPAFHVGPMDGPNGTSRYYQKAAAMLFSRAARFRPRLLLLADDCRRCRSFTLEQPWIGVGTLGGPRPLPQHLRDREYCTTVVRSAFTRWSARPPMFIALTLAIFVDRSSQGTKIFPHLRRPSASRFLRRRRLRFHLLPRPRPA